MPQVKGTFPQLYDDGAKQLARRYKGAEKSKAPAKTKAPSRRTPTRTK